MGLPVLKMVRENGEGKIGANALLLCNIGPFRGTKPNLTDRGGI